MIHHLLSKIRKNPLIRNRGVRQANSCAQSPEFGPFSAGGIWKKPLPKSALRVKEVTGDP
jgi:hypothetical protein